MAKKNHDLLLLGLGMIAASVIPKIMEHGFLKGTQRPRKICPFCNEDHGDFGLCRDPEARKRWQESVKRGD